MSTYAFPCRTGQPIEDVYIRPNFKFIGGEEKQSDIVRRISIIHITTEEYRADTFIDTGTKRHED